MYIFFVAECFKFSWNASLENVLLKWQKYMQMIKIHAVMLIFCKPTDKKKGIAWSQIIKSVPTTY